MNRKVGYYTAEKYDLGINPYNTKYFGKKEFPTEVMLDKAKLAFKEANKKKNKLYRLNKTIESYDEEAKINILETLHKDNILTTEEEITMKIRLKKTLDLQLDKNTGNTTCIIGSSKQGKSTLMMFIYNKYYSSNRWITTLYTDSPQSFGGNELINNRLIIFPGFEPRTIRGEKLINQNCSNKYKFCNLFDDIISVRHKNELNKMILTYRNSNMSTVICIQYSNLLAKMTRGNYNNILLFQQNTDEATSVVIKTFLRNVFRQLGLKTMPEMIEFYKMHTGNFKFMYYIPNTEQLTFHRLNL